MIVPELNTDEYYTSPKSFVERRSTIEPVEAYKFNSLLGIISRVVFSQPEYYFRTGEGATMTYWDGKKAMMGDKTDVIEEIDGPLRSADNRVMDLRLFTKEHGLRQNLGFVAYAGIDWKATPHLSDAISSEELAEGLLDGGLHIKEDFGSIDTLWVLSSDNRNNWITSYTDARPITDFEYDQLADDLLAYPSI